MNDHPANPMERTSKVSTGWLVLGVLFFVAVGCSTPSIRPAPLSESAVRLDLPLVRQDALYDCGLASISALCHYWGLDMPADERAALALTAENNAGLSGSDLSTALEELGLEVFLFQGTLDRTATGIYGQVDAGRPPLVMLSPDGTRHHYGLVLGYDEPRGNLILLDPTRGEILVNVAIFDRNWARCQRFTLLACVREGAQVALPRRDAHDARADLSNNPSRARGSLTTTSAGSPARN